MGMGMGMDHTSRWCSGQGDGCENRFSVALELLSLVILQSAWLEVAEERSTRLGKSRTYVSLSCSRGSGGSMMQDQCVCVCACVCVWECGSVGVWECGSRVQAFDVSQGGSWVCQRLLPPPLSELRESGFGLVSCLPPSGEGGWVSSAAALAAWTVLDFCSTLLLLWSPTATMRPVRAPLLPLPGVSLSYAINSLAWQPQHLLSSMLTNCQHAAQLQLSPTWTVNACSPVCFRPLSCPMQCCLGQGGMRGAILSC
jgi:hypothetical protein